MSRRLLRNRRAMARSLWQTLYRPGVRVIEQYFWLMGALVVGPYLTIGAWRLSRPVVQRHPELANERRRVTVGVGLMFILAPLVFGLLQRLGGLDARSIFGSRFDNPYASIAVVIAFLMYFVPIFLVWTGRTTELISGWPGIKFGPKAIQALGTLLPLICMAIFLATLW